MDTLNLYIRIDINVNQCAVTVFTCEVIDWIQSYLHLVLRLYKYINSVDLHLFFTLHSFFICFLTLLRGRVHMFVRWLEGTEQHQRALEGRRTAPPHQHSRSPVRQILLRRGALPLPRLRRA